MSSKGSIMNFCQPNGGGMSICDLAEAGYEKQQQCSFCNGVSSGGSYCINLVFDEYCGRLAAQKHANGQPINLREVKGYEDGWNSEYYYLEDNSGQIPQEDMNEMLEQIKKISKDAEIEVVTCEESVRPDTDLLLKEGYYRAPDGMIRRVPLSKKSVLEQHEEIHRRFREDPFSQERLQRAETLTYIRSRKISPSVIQERLAAGLIVCIEAELVLGYKPAICKDQDDGKLLFDKEYLVLYHRDGKLAEMITRIFFDRKAYMWRKLVPKDALPKYKDYSKPIVWNV